jgi:MFS family permease
MHVVVDQHGPILALPPVTRTGDAAAAQALLAVLVLTGSAEVWHVVVVAAVRGVSAAFFMPASSGLVPQTVRPEQLQQANALLGLSRNATGIGGAAAGGLLVAA